MKPNDHDVLIQVSTKLDDLTRQVRELRDGTITRIIALEKDKADRVEVQALQTKLNHDIEIRVRFLEDKGNKSSGFWGGISDFWKIILAILAIATGILTIVATYHHG